MENKEQLKKKLDDKTGTYMITINPRVNGFNIISQVICYLNFNKSILDLKKEFFQQLKMYHHNYMFDEANLMNNIEIQGNMNGKVHSNIQQLPNKTKIKDFECSRPYFSFYFPRVVQVKIEDKETIFVFNADDFVTSMNKFFKSKMSLDITKCSINEKPITLTSKINEIFDCNNVNIIKQVKIKVVEGKTNNFGSMYLIQTREFQSQNIPIYKIGKTGNDISERLGKYGKGGQVLFTMAVDITKLDHTELELINNFRTKYNQKVEIGTEYFEGDYKEMIEDMYVYLKNLL